MQSPGFSRKEIDPGPILEELSPGVGRGAWVGGDNEHGGYVITSREGAAIALVPFGRRSGC